MKKNRIVDILGYQLMVDDTEYEFYWNAKRCGEKSEAFVIACRRLLGIGPNGREITISSLNFVGGSEVLNTLSKSSLVNHIEHGSSVFQNETSDLSSREYIVNSHDDEFETELEL